MRGDQAVIAAATEAPETVACACFHLDPTSRRSSESGATAVTDDQVGQILSMVIRWQEMVHEDRTT
ncbi:hypothetical protein ACIRG5_19875 [Lentzea sp. NPDC102401]|uniref:hypothetical protein n=1 Tax=Lentzea sp. NPDC102401 TaxID=3364128 RepID=UPI0037F94A65